MANMRAIAVALIALGGVVLSFTSTHAAPTETVLYSFTGGSDGGAPQGVLIVDSVGNLYGTASAGGSTNCKGGCGVVFKLSPPAETGQKWTEAVLYAFKGGTDGSTPLSELIFDDTGTLYGTTAQGGGSAQCTGGCGTVFKLSPPAASGKPWGEMVLHRFVGGASGSGPLGGLVMGSGGALFGTTAKYPAPTTSTCLGTPCGTVFKLAPPVAGGVNWRLKVLHIFAGGNDGSLPLGTLFLGKGAILYGVTGLGGSTHCASFGCGIVFEMIPPIGARKTWTETAIHIFQGPQSLGGFDGAYPSSDLVMDASGALYGTIVLGPGNGCILGCGGVFKLTPPAAHSTEWAEETLYAFQGGKDGASPATGHLAFNKAGVLFGTTPFGGAASEGTIFRLTPAGATGGWTEAVIHSFHGTADGSIPQGGVILVSGLLYGTTTKGGLSGAGTVFQIN